jgi:hypothetical protein
MAPLALHAGLTVYSWTHFNNPSVQLLHSNRPSVCTQVTGRYELNGFSRFKIENQLSFGLCPSSWIKYKNIKPRRFGRWLFFRLQVSPLPSPEDGRRPSSETSWFYILSRKMDKVQKTVGSQCYIPSSEPFRIRFKIFKTSSLFSLY